MTAEIVVMNTGGIALATDSALTIRGQKVYNSANKLFHFSKEHTIGVMTYGLSSMFHVPWETLIKVFEKKLNSHAFDTVKEYMEDFLQFLNQNNYDQFMTEVNEERFIDQTLYSNLNRLYEELSHMNKSLYSDYGELRLQNEIQEMYVHQADHYLAKRNQILTEKVFPKGFDQSDYDQLFEKYENRVVELIQNKFEDHLYIEEWLDTIKDLMIQSLIKDFSNNYSGIVFAGYGKKEIFPSLYLIIIDGKINNKTKYFIRKKTVNHTTHAVILPFAQRDMIRSFLDGIHEEVEDFISTELKNEFSLLPNILVEHVKDNLKEGVDVALVESEMSNALMQVYDQYQKKLSDFKREQFIYPILDVVESLPTKELAHMAESLLNVASLKRKISISMETVGGPIDVAIITKGDGFTWVKKK